MKKLLNSILGIVPALAIALAITSVSAPCHFVLYQPDVPEELKRYEV